MRTIAINFCYPSEAPVRSHLKNVYATLTMSIMAASAGAYVHLFTDILKVKRSHNQSIAKLKKKGCNM